MEKQDFKYMGSFVQEVFVYRLYLSADEQTFQPFNPDHLDLLEL